MPPFNINWRGYPHRHLPSIRPTSIRRASITSRSAVQTAAEEVFRTPLSVALQNERRKQKSIACRRRSRSSRSSGPVARKRLSGTTARRPQGFRKQIPRIQSRRKQADGKFGTKSSRSEAEDGSRQPPCSPSARTVLDVEDTDGARASHAPKTRGQQPEVIYSSVRETNGPLDRVQFNPTAREQEVLVSKEVKCLETKRGECARTRRSETISSQEKRHPQITGWRRNYDLRIDPRCHVDCVDSPNSNTRYSTRKFHSIAKSSAPVTRVRYHGADDAALWETIDSTRFPPDDATSSSPTIASPSQITTSNVRRGPRSEVKKFARFQKELQLYYQAVSTLPKQTLLASPSATTISAKTVKELVPYRAEFQAAGLAVTSTEQQCTTPSKKIDLYSPCISRIADRRLRQPPGGHDGLGSIASGTTGTTVLEFTPPHEKTYGLANKDRARGSETGSDATHIGFTPPHEKMIAPCAPSPAPARTAQVFPTGTSIPWLGGQHDKSPKAPISPAQMSSASACLNSCRNEESLNSAEIFQATTPVIAPDWMPRQLTGEKRDSLNMCHEILPDFLLESVVEVHEVVQTGALKYADAITQTTEITSAVPTSTESPEAKGQVQVDQPLPPEQEDSARSAATISSEKQSLKRGPESNEICGWRRRRLPWERPYEAAKVAPVNCPLTPNSHEDLCNVPKAKAIQSADSEAQNKHVIVQGPTASESTCVVLRCTHCNDCIGSTTESLGGQIRSTSSQELCKPCSDSAYTTYVVPRSRSPPLARRNGQPQIQKITEERLEGLETECTPELEVEDIDEGRLPKHLGFFIKNVGQSIVEFAKDNPVSDPVKRPHLPSSHPVSRQSHRLLPQNCSRRHEVPSSRQYTASAKQRQQRAEGSREHLQTPFEPVSTTVSSKSCIQKPQRITNQSIFNGLQVATAAACDKDLDGWLKEVNGSGVRCFLADLSKFEPLGINALAKVAKQVAKARRERLHDLEGKREANLKDRLHGIQVEIHTHNGKHLHRGLETESHG